MVGGRNMGNQTIGYKVFTIINNTVMFLLVLTMLYPFVYVVLASFSDSNALMGHVGFLFKPIEPTLAAYKMVFDNPMILSGYINTMIVLVIGLSVNMVMTILAAYVLSRKNFALRNTLMFFIVITMFFNGGLVPTYLTVEELGMGDSLWALIIPTAMSAYNMIIMRTSFAAIPDSLIESATLDGASNLRVLLNIVLPLSKAVMAVIVLYYAVGIWNSWFNAMIYLRDRMKFPLQLILREILLENNSNDMNIAADTGDAAVVRETMQYALIVVATVPILCIYPFVQKFFVKGVMIGAVKG